MGDAANVRVPLSWNWFRSLWLGIVSLSGVAPWAAGTILQSKEKAQERDLDLSCISGDGSGRGCKVKCLWDDYSVCSMTVRGQHQTISGGEENSSIVRAPR